MKKKFMEIFMSNPEDRMYTIGFGAVAGVYVLLYVVCDIIEIIFGVAM